MPPTEKLDISFVFSIVSNKFHSLRYSVFHGTVSTSVNSTLFHSYTGNFSCKVLKSKSFELNVIIRFFRSSVMIYKMTLSRHRIAEIGYLENKIKGHVREEHTKQITHRDFPNRTVVT